jgi:iron complex transport system permease protein
MKTSRVYALSIALLAVALLLTAVLSLGLGAVRVAPGDVLLALFGSANAPRMARTIVWDLRLPRILLGILIGGGLATAGAAFQGLFRNPLADPFVVGASGGASLGATLAIYFGARWALVTGTLLPQTGLFALGPVPLAAFVGALLAVGLVYAIAESGGGAPIVALVLAGTALSTLLSAIVALLMTTSDSHFQATYAWLLGGLSGRSWWHLQATWPYLAFGILSLWLLSRPLDALSFGDETAQSLGLSIRRARALIIVAATLTTAASVAAAGIIGFVGLIAPHVARLFFGAAHRRLIPASALLGGLLVLLADDLARAAWAPIEVPVGVITAVLGAPFFLYLLKTRQRHLGGGL